MTRTPPSGGTEPRAVADAETGSSVGVGPPLDLALVIYGDLDSTSGGFRYDREVVSRLRERGDSVEVISLPWRRYGRGLADALDPRVRDRLDRDVDVLVEDGLCHPSTWRHNRRLSGPDAIVGLVHHVRSDDPTERYASLMRPFERRFLHSVDATVSTSGFTRGRVQRIAPSTATAPALVAPPAGRIQGAATTADRVRERARRGPLRIAFVGNVVPRKNLETLLDAVSRLTREATRSVETGRSSGRRVDWRLTVVGNRNVDPAYAERLAGRTRALGLDDRVEFVGELTDDALASTLETSHVCCVPARYEAFGMVHLEAMEHGTVPIAGAVGGTGEFLREGHNGFLVDPDDDRTIAEHLERLATDRERLGSLGVAALRTAERHPGWAETTERFRAFLRSVVDGTSGDDRCYTTTRAHGTDGDVGRAVRPRRAASGVDNGGDGR